MYKFLIILLICIISLPLKADWELLAVNAYETKVYIDNEKIKRGLIRRDNVTYWVMTNYGKNDPFRNMNWKNPINSSLSEYKVDCKKKSFRFSQFIYFELSNAKGKKHKVSGIPDEWRSSNSIQKEEQELLRIVCNFN